jgi:hypothetical protein
MSSYPAYRRCRFCDETTIETRLVKYGVRHYAHHHCYLDAGKSLDDLPASQVGDFPWRLIKDHGLGPQVERILNEYDRRRQLVEETLARLSKGAE